MAQSATHRAPWIAAARHRVRSEQRGFRVRSRRLAIGTAVGLLVLAGALCTVSLIELRQPLMAISAVAIPTCLVVAAFALSFADRVPSRD